VSIPSSRACACLRLSLSFDSVNPSWCWLCVPVDQ
jgi:hypothetical protein